MKPPLIDKLPDKYYNPKGAVFRLSSLQGHMLLDKVRGKSDFARQAASEPSIYYAIIIGTVLRIDEIRRSKDSVYSKMLEKVKDWFENGYELSDEDLTTPNNYVYSSDDKDTYAAKYNHWDIVRKHGYIKYVQVSFQTNKTYFKILPEIKMREVALYSNMDPLRWIYMGHIRNIPPWSDEKFDKAVEYFTSEDQKISYMGKKFIDSMLRDILREEEARKKNIALLGKLEDDIDQY